MSAGMDRSRGRRCGSIALAALVALVLTPSSQGVGSQYARVIDFEEAGSEEPVSVLQSAGFTLHRDAADSRKVTLAVDNGRLDLQTHRPAHAILINERFEFRDFSTIEIVWGVEAYPEGASYARSINNEAIMVTAFLGREKQPSGSMFIPDSPHFIGLFLCESDETQRPFVGRYFQKGGRYICLDRPEPGQEVTSRFDLWTAYRNYFDPQLDHNPAVTGIAISIDTSAIVGGQAKAFIRRIKLFR